MSTQLNALLAALATGAQEIFEAIRVDAEYYEQHLNSYDPYEFLGLEQLHSTQNIEIKHYLHVMAELGTDGHDDQLWGAISVAVLEDNGTTPRILASQRAVNKETIDNE